MASIRLTLSPTPSQLFQRPKPTSFSSIKCCQNTAEFDKISHNGHVSYPETSRHMRPAADHPLRPCRIILVRHGESEGNVDENVYAKVPNPKIPLIEKGKAQAKECGRRIREIIEKDGADDWKVYFYVSPYRRTLETLQHLGRAFERSRISGVIKEPRIREQDFGK